MSRIILSVSISLDGYAAGPRVRPEEPMGDRGELLHAWMDGTGPGADIDARMMDAINAAAGATIVGRRTFDLGERFWGGTPWPNTPAFVVTHEPLDDRTTENGGRFVFTDLDTAAARAREAAGERDVLVLGPNICQQLLAAGEVDELWLQIVPVILGGGTPLFDGPPVDLEPIDPPVAGAVTHLRLRPAPRS